MREKEDKKMWEERGSFEGKTEEKKYSPSHCVTLLSSLLSSRPILFPGFLRIPERTGHLYLPRADSSGISLH